MGATRGARRRARKATVKPRKKKPPRVGGGPLPTELNRLVELYREGRFSELHGAARTVSARWPAHPLAWNLQAAALRQMGRVEEAVEAAERVAVIQPRDPQIQANLGLLLTDLGRYEEAVRACRQSLALNPDYAVAHFTLGTALMGLGRHGDADVAFQRALDLDPALHGAHFNRGNALHAMGRLQEAEACYRLALQAQPDYPLALNNLGNALYRQGRLDEAEGAYRKALSLDEACAEGHANLGTTLFELGRPSDAEEAYRKALQLRPEYLEARYNLGNALYAMGRKDEAEAAYRTVLEQDPEYAQAHNNLGNVQWDRGRLPEAAASYRRAIAIQPDHTEAHNNLGNTLYFMGRKEEAEAAFRRALEIVPDSPNAHYGISRLRKAQPREKAFDILRGVLDSPSEWTPRDRMRAHFALGKMHADIGEPDPAFHHHTEGHRERAVYLDHAYDPAVIDAKLKALTTVFSSSFFEARPEWGSPSTMPILVVGMPRSGTSLIEQILASHSRVHGAGELRALGDLVDEIWGEGSPEKGWKRIGGLSPEGVEELAERYLAHLREVSGGSPRVVDKMPHNFETLWLAALLFPRATILHAVRSPLDTCLSCFFQNFHDGHAYTDDLRSLGHHYNYYAALMKHWKAVLPLPIHDVVYEELVADPEGKIPELLEFCGLAFEEGCMEFHTTTRAVRTASAAQVRRKVYTSSVEKWRRYEKHLGPLMEVLDLPI